MGANAVLALSVATLLAAADSWRVAPWRLRTADQPPTLPLPLVNVVSGGTHADLSVDVQDFLIVPVGAQTFGEAAEWCCRARTGTAGVARRMGLTDKLVADEGRLGPGLRSNRDALQLLVEGIEQAGLRPGNDVALAVDIAATHLHRDGAYDLDREGRRLTAEGMVDEVADWAREFPLVSVEDVLREDDWEGWARATTRLCGLQVVGDDLFATNEDLLRTGADRQAASAILVKPNQNGTLSSTAQVVETAKKAGYRVVMSDRSGETDDSWLADLAVLWDADQIKLGSTMRSERTAKWNRLLQIEAELGRSARYAGADALQTVRRTPRQVLDDR